MEQEEMGDIARGRTGLQRRRFMAQSPSPPHAFQRTGCGSVPQSASCNCKAGWQPGCARYHSDGLRRSFLGGDRSLHFLANHLRRRKKKPDEDEGE
ncbi:unnamed protein product [Sphagnum jensenii]|uniref:Uncharacterized protein n=1 Tax=Sphagnum jensenii TaxID=128206 RepID=A0ABP1BZ73_9BRYO